jgi:hypothetical protein
MTSPRDLFANTGGGSFPKFDEFEGKLILLKPELIESVPKPEKFGGGVQDRLTATAVVFEEDGTWEEYEDMYFSQVGIVNPARKTLKPNARTRFVLGRVAKVPSKIGKDQGFDTTEKIVKGLEDWAKKGGRGDKPNYAWGLQDYSDADLAMAMAYLNETSPFASSDAEAS